MGSPATQRNLRQDSQRVSDLSIIQNQIVYYWQKKNKLPERLSDLNDPISGFKVPTDPETDAAYAYQVTGELGFELCADFELPSPTLPADSGSGRYYPGPYYEVPLPESSYGVKAVKGAGVDSWQHGEGRACFEREIDPEIYRPYRSN